MKKLFEISAGPSGATRLRGSSCRVSVLVNIEYRSLGDLVSCILSPKVSFSLEHCSVSWAPETPLQPPGTSSSNSLGRSGSRVLRVFSWVSPWDWSCRPRGSKTRLRGLLLASSWLLLGSSWAPLGPLLGAKIGSSWAQNAS